MHKYFKDKNGRGSKYKETKNYLIDEIAHKDLMSQRHVCI